MVIDKIEAIQAKIIRLREEYEDEKAEGLETRLNIMLRCRTDLDDKYRDINKKSVGIVYSWTDQKKLKNGEAR